MAKNLQTGFVFFVGFSFPLILSSNPLPSSGNDVTEEVWVEEVGFPCDPLKAEGTALLCFPPEESIGNGSKSKFGNPGNCSHPSVPGTIASFSCRNLEGGVYTGFLKCAKSGVWIVSLMHANNSLCNLDASIVNFEVPDVMIATNEPRFTTPVPSQLPTLDDLSFLKEYEKMALQIHNIFRKNHGVPQLKMTEQLNNFAQQLVDSITSFGDIEDLESNLKLNPIHRTMNVEMNWYFQVPSSPNLEEGVSNGVQTWYSGFRQYDWENLDANLEVGDALAFSRVIWKGTQLIGVGAATAHNITFVACAYTPGRNIISTEPANELKLNVPHFQINSS